MYYRYRIGCQGGSRRLGSSVGFNGSFLVLARADFNFGLSTPLAGPDPAEIVPTLRGPLQGLPPLPANFVSDPNQVLMLTHSTLWHNLAH